MKKVLAFILCIIMATGTLIPAHAMDKSKVEGAKEKISNYADTYYGSVYAFDDLNEFVLGKDFIEGGNYKNAATGVKLTNEKDHTGTLLGGKSLLISERTQTYNRIKFLNSLSSKPFTGNDIGKHFTVSAYALATERTTIQIGVFNTISDHTYSSTPYVFDKKTLEADEWTKFQFEFTVTNDFIANSISVISFNQLDGSKDTLLYFDDIVVTYKGESMIFDNKDSFTYLKDFELGGAYPTASTNFTLVEEENHTNEGKTEGKSLKLTGRTSKSHRFKFLKLFKDTDFTEEDIGCAFEVRMYVKTDIDAKIRLGTYSKTGTAYAFTPYRINAYDIPKDTWTPVSQYLIVDEKIVENGISMLGIDQPSNDKNVATTIYVDDVLVEKKDEKFYFKEEVDADAMFNALPEGEVLITPEEFIASAPKTAQTGSFSKHVVTDETSTFTNAVHYSVKSKPEVPHSYQHIVKYLGQTIQKNDQLLVVCHIRGISSESSSGNCHIQFVSEDSDTYKKALQSDYKFPADGIWRKCYFASGAVSEYENQLRLQIRCGYEIQEFEIANLQLLRYPIETYPDLTYSDMPDMYSSYNGGEPNSEWRDEAEERIKLIRMGQAKVKVQDKNGNPISNVKVDIDMTDHSFQFGTAVNGTLLTTPTYQQNVGIYFNTAVLESEHKWHQYEKNSTRPREMYNKLKELGIKNVRGHTLLWDVDFINKEWVDNTKIPEDVAKNYADREYVDSRIENHIKTILTDYNGQLCDWDVVNELTANHAMTEYYNKTTLKQWFDWAKKYDDNAVRFINETGITGNNDSGLNGFRKYLDFMVENDVDFEGIGIQSHFASTCDILDFKRQLDILASYGKRLKITEFDFNKDGVIQGEFTRDIMKLAFSLPQMDGFVSWGFTDRHHWLKNAILLDNNWNMKQSGEQYVDHVFNQWWTDESGKTNEDGEYITKVFYGDHNVTLKYNGTTIKETFSFERGKDNTLVVTIDTDAFEFTPSRLKGKVFHFDDMSKITNNVQYVAGGAYPAPASNILISSDEDHTNGNGKSLYLKGRTARSHRIKLKNALGNEFGGKDIGKTFEVTCFIKPLITSSVYVGMYGDANTKYATSALYGIDAAVTENVWNEIKFNFEVTKEMVDNKVNMFGIGQISGSVIGSMYVDDIIIKEITYTNDFENPNTDFFFETTSDFLSSNAFVANGNGNSHFSIENRENLSDGVKIKNLFKLDALSSDDLNKTFSVTMKVKADKNCKIKIGTYNEEGVSNKNKVYGIGSSWKTVMFTYTPDSNAITNSYDILGISQEGLTTNVAEEIYIDDIKITAAEGFVPTKYIVNIDATKEISGGKATLNITSQPWINFENVFSSYTVIVASYDGENLLDASSYVVSNPKEVKTVTKELNAKDNSTFKIIVLNTSNQPIQMAKTVK